ncbi:DUF6875 domain-containing protein [Nocardia sp. NBC_01327]|uniref:DUF6875 domain-containing protein n=1 Tax=Nocardia sp. NBC_01327 TaxID=2903593 RepID=UPI002E0D9826|nr:hypothetical protein OG326_16390 [Nocardia sp. NBC_01327]
MSGVTWCNVYGEPQRWEQQGPAAATLVRWVSDHLLKPHAGLGRPGPVCPFMRHTTTRQLLWAGAATGTDWSTEGMQGVMDDAFAVYARLRQENPADSRGLTLVTLFPDLSRHELIDAVHRARKTQAVAAGLMLGQFYPGCTVPGLWNSDFHPLDAPVPMLVLRPMMSTDFPFLVARTEWLYAYFTRFAPDLPGKLRWAIAERMRVVGPEAGEITALRMHSAGEHAR